MSEGVKFFDGLINGIKGSIRSCMICRIERYDPVTMQADITPLHHETYKDGTSVPMPLIPAVPVAHLKAGPFIIRPPYQRGDIVVAAFSDYSTEEALLTGEAHPPRSHRKHALDDAIIVGGIMPYTQQYPAQHGSDLLIAKDDLSAKIVIREDNTVLIETNSDVKVTAAGDIDLDSDRKVTVTAKSGIDLSSPGPVNVTGSQINLN